jgi:hypothetical protein
MRRDVYGLRPPLCFLCEKVLDMTQAYCAVFVDPNPDASPFWKKRPVPGIYCHGCCDEASRQSLALFVADPVKWRSTWEEWEPTLAAADSSAKP